MRRCALATSLFAFCFFPLALSWASAAPSNAPPDIAKAATGFTNALQSGDFAASWQMLSSPSRAQMNAMQWEEAIRVRPSSRPPTGNDLLRALATAEEPPTVSDTLIEKDEALVKVSGSVRITQELVLVKEGGVWRVDLAATDEINAREAARVFIEAIGSASAPTARPVRTPQAGIPMLRALLMPEAKDYYVLSATVKSDRAQVTLASDLPVSLVLRAVRSGPGWMVDLTRPLVSVNPLSKDPIKEAAEANIQNACQEQLRQVARAFQMYAQANDDMLPDPDRWVQQLRPFLGDVPNVLHCPADTTPGISYAMNRNLAGKKRSQVGNQPTTPLLYESTLHTTNPADRGESWPSPAFHSGGNMVLFVDGSARPVEGKPSFTVIEAQRPIAMPERPGAGGRERPPVQPQRRRAPQERAP